MSIESISAVQRCMIDLGLHSNDAPTFEVQAIIKDAKKLYIKGNLIVTFHGNVHSGEGPFIEAGEEIRGFGIPFTCFKPVSQKFTYADGTKSLFVSGNGYAFIVDFNDNA